MNRIPYTYFIKQRDTGYFYYGVKYAKNADPKTFWKKYFTSSKTVHLLIEKYGEESFDFQIRKIFNDPIKAKKWEDKVIRRIMHWPNCLNISNGGDALRSHKNRHIKDENGLSSYDKAAIKTSQVRKERGDFEKLSKKMKGVGIGHIHICEYCGKKVKGTNYTRWHGQNCKMNPNITEAQIKKRKPWNKGKKCQKRMN